MESSFSLSNRSTIRTTCSKVNRGLVAVVVLEPDDEVRGRFCDCCWLVEDKVDGCEVLPSDDVVLDEDNEDDCLSLLRSELYSEYGDELLFEL